MNKNDKKAHRSPKGLIDPSKVKTFEVHHETDLLSFLTEKMPNLSNKTLRHIIANHQVAVGGVPVSLFAYRLYPEDEVLVSYNQIKKRQLRPLDIIYEDDDLIAINKPSGLLSVATDREKGKTAYRFVSDYLVAKNRNARAFVVHRLDEDTSGVLVFAKNYETREALQNHWQEIVEKRGYYAIVEGEDIPDRGRLENYLTQNDLHLVFITKNKAVGKLAITNYMKMAAKNGLALLDINIESGRKNQIRVQLGNIGHYVIGDDKYGEPSNPLGRLGLHAYELIFTNPLSKKRYDFKTEMPKEFKTLFWKPHRPVETQKGGKPGGRRQETTKARRVQTRR